MKVQLLRPLLIALVLIGGACSGEGDAMSTTDGDVPTTSTTGVEASSTTAGGLLADDIPVAHTPPGGYGEEMPPPILAGCTEPLVEGAPDLRGTWKAVAVEVDGKPAPDHRAMGHVERVEQCGDRLVVTAGGVIHDMRCDGTEENGVNDVAEMDFTTEITVVATYEDGVHTLRPVGIPIEVTRELDGDQMIWTYLGFTARLERIDPDASTED